MKNRFSGLRIFTALAVAVILMSSSALAEFVSFSGTVVAKDTADVLADIGGTVDSVNVIAGQEVAAGEVLASFRTTKVYATADGTVTGIFAQLGDSADTAATNYGAVLYVEPTYQYTIAGSTDSSYDAEDNKFVHVGESVYLKGYSDATHTGTGTVTAVSGTDFTVRVDEGEFLVGETVSVFRDSEYASKSRIGRGELSRTDPVAYTGSGSIVNIAVTDGQTVARGDLLFETLDGTYDAYYMSGLDILSPVSGIVAEVKATEDSALSKDETAFVIYPDGGMWIEASIEESDLGNISVGDTVLIEFTWNEDDDVTYDGTVEMISAIGTSSDTGVTYPVYISFTPDETVKYGMTVVVSSIDEEAEDDTADVSEEAEQPAESPTPEATSND